MLALLVEWLLRVFACKFVLFCASELEEWLLLLMILLLLLLLLLLWCGGGGLALVAGDCEAAMRASSAACCCCCWACAGVCPAGGAAVDERGAPPALRPAQCWFDEEVPAAAGCACDGGRAGEAAALNSRADAAKWTA